MPKRTKVAGYENLYRINESPKIYLIDSFPGFGEVVRSTRQTDPEKAAKVAKTLIRAILKLDPSYKPTTIEEVAREYMEVLSSQWRASTKAHVEGIVEGRIIPFLGDCPVNGPLRARWAKFTTDFYAGKLQFERPGITERKKSTNHPAPTTLYNTRKWFMAILNYARDEGYLTKSLGERKGRRKKKLFPINDPKTRPGMYIPFTHFQRILTACTERSYSVKLFTLIGYHTGMRENEILGLGRARIDLTEKSFTLRPEDVKTGSVTGEGRKIAIPPQILPELTAWLARNPSEHLFPSDTPSGRVENILLAWRRALKRAGLPDYNPNDLRHTFFTNKVLIEGKNLTSVAIYGGTSTALLEKTYVKDKFKNTRSVVEGAATSLSDENGVLPGMSSESVGKHSLGSEVLH